MSSSGKQQSRYRLEVTNSEAWVNTLKRATDKAYARDHIPGNAVVFRRFLSKDQYENLDSMGVQVTDNAWGVSRSERPVYTDVSDSESDEELR